MGSAGSRDDLQDPEQCFRASTLQTVQQASEDAVRTLTDDLRNQ